MGRLWQTLILGKWKEIFFFLPIESLIKDRQQRYYEALEKAAGKMVEQENPINRGSI